LGAPSENDPLRRANEHPVTGRANSNVLAQEPIASDATFAEKLNWLERIGALPSAAHQSLHHPVTQTNWCAGGGFARFVFAPSVPLADLDPSLARSKEIS
jgi:hypothetical protein